jgi:predicted enzyme related to lactoylglutathione lyase
MLTSCCQQRGVSKHNHVLETMMMNIRNALIAALVTTTSISSPAPLLGQTIEVQRFGLYVLVDDVERSVAFYEVLFGEVPQIRTPALVGFDVAGGLFGVVDRASYGQGAPAGGGVRPYIRVLDIEFAFARVSALAPGRIETPGIVTEGPFRFFRFSDPDGNSLEFFSFTPPTKRK